MDLYVVLGLRLGATESEIKRAYRRLARRFHPDINPGDRMAEARFRQILEAYETLIDPDRRSRYDSGAGSEVLGARRTSGFEGFDFSARGVDHSATFGDLFAEVLADRGARRPAPERGADLHHAVQVAFEEAFAGTTRPVAVTRRETCRTCAGTGRTRMSPGACHVCQGTGAVRSVRVHMVFSRSCPGCGGSGQQRPRPCESCGGTGQETRSETVQVRIPAGTSDGDRVRVAGKGNAGIRGGPPGDLYITAHVAPHPVFRRESNDVHIVLPIAVHEAALGARIDVPTPDGSARLRVPPGTQSGQRFRLRERGAASTRDGRRGDFVVEVRLMLPKLLDERSKELLREFGKINGENVREHPG
ncbi:MAG: J domain-containing protein [Acidobacteria bacterium]|nr:J domain-containing protein [Acidobacteriota bacterium]